MILEDSGIYWKNVNNVSNLKYFDFQKDHDFIEYWCHVLVIICQFLAALAALYLTLVSQSVSQFYIVTSGQFCNLTMFSCDLAHAHTSYLSFLVRHQFFLGL